jgi:uncharacterized membrane protein
MKKGVASTSANQGSSRPSIGPYGVLTALLILFCLLVASRGLAESYSYWSDEIWSVAASRASWGSLFRDWLLPDTHPPLYQVLLKIWMGLTGSGEAATRSLSFLMAAFSLVAAALCCSPMGAGRRLVTVAFLGTSPAFLFYAQETRSYATSAAFSTLMLGSALLLRRRSYGSAGHSHTWILRLVFATSALLLSLTHYFSLLFVLVVLAVATADGAIFRSKKEAILLLALIMVCPLAHALLSNPSDKLARIDWIQVAPVTGTLTQYIAGILPLVDPREGPRVLKIALVLAGGIAFAMGPLLRPRSSLRATPAAGDARFLTLIMLGFLVLMLLLDPIKPMSFDKYYIVVLPALAYLLGAAWEITVPLPWFRKAVLAALLVFVMVQQLAIGRYDLAQKRLPRENYKAMASFVAASGICKDACWSTGWLLEAVTGSYFKPGQLLEYKPTATQKALPLDRPLLAFKKSSRNLEDVFAANPDMVCWEAPSATPRGTIVLLPRTTSARPEQHGLRPCAP